VTLHGQEEKESQEEGQEEEVTLFSRTRGSKNSVRHAAVFRTDFLFLASAPKEAIGTPESFHATAEAFFFCAEAARKRGLPLPADIWRAGLCAARFGR
jgi:hypothetical protein